MNLKWPGSGTRQNLSGYLPQPRILSKPITFSSIIVLRLIPGRPSILQRLKVFQKLLTRLYFQSALQIGRKTIADGLGQFNPFESPFTDTSLITLDQMYSNSFSFNRFSSKWGIDINNIRTSGRAFLSYGYETKKLNDWNMKARVNIGKSYTWDIITRLLTNRQETPQFNNRNFDIKGISMEPRFTYTKGTDFRGQLSYKWDDR